VQLPRYAKPVIALLGVIVVGAGWLIVTRLGDETALSLDDHSLSVGDRTTLHIEVADEDLVWGPRAILEKNVDEDWELIGYFYTKARQTKPGFEFAQPGGNAINPVAYSGDATVPFEMPDLDPGAYRILMHFSASATEDDVRATAEFDVIP
jgi:hypothetical protein